MSATVLQPVPPTQQIPSTKRMPPELRITRDDSWDTYNLEWLFDPDRMDHLPIEEQVKLYKQRDLAKVKFFKTACKIFGAPQSRRRVIIAPPMHTAEDKEVTVAPPQERTVSELKPKVQPPSMPTQEQLDEWKKWDKEAEYKKWVAERQGFRKNLENMGLNEQWLAGKTDKTPLEHRVLNRLLEEKYPRPPTPEKKTLTTLEFLKMQSEKRLAENPDKQAMMADMSPLVNRPSPEGIKIIEEHLRQHKMRLIDRGKKWHITRDDFRVAIKKANIPISDVLLEDLILTLDTDLDNELDYRELAKGMGLWKKEKIQSKRRLIESRSMNHSPTKYSQISGFETPAEEEEEVLNVVGRDSLVCTKSAVRSAQSTKRRSVGGLQLSPRVGGGPRVRSAVSAVSDGSAPTRLEPPGLDVRREQRIMSDEAMVDLRKHNRNALPRLSASWKSGHSSPLHSGTTSIRRRSTRAGRGIEATATDEELRTPRMIRSGCPHVDSHVALSTLSGVQSGMIDEFRQDRLREYHDIGKLCSENELPFTEDTIKRVFLYPGDKDIAEIKKKIRQPAMSLLSRSFHSSADDDDDDEGRRGKRGKRRGGKGGRNGKLSPLRSGKNMFAEDEFGRIECREAYPKQASIKVNKTRMKLSTGKATIKPLVDCWMTFEEYDRLTKHLATHYILPEHEPNAIFPGALLDKMRLMLEKEDGATCNFQRVSHNPPPVISGYNNNLNTWPINDRGYVTYGTIEK